MPLAYPDTTLFRKVDELGDKLQPMVITKPGTTDTDTVWVDVSKLPLREYEAEDSLANYYGDTMQPPHFTKFLLTFGYRGWAEYYKIKPLRNVFIPVPPPQNPFSGLLCAGLMFDQRLKFEDIELQGTFFFRSFGAQGRIEFAPTDTVDTWRVRFGPVYKIKL